MMRVTAVDGAVFEGADAAAVVRAMKRDDWSAPARKAEYMDEVSDRVEQMTGVPVDDSDPAAFLAGLEQQGFVTITDSGVVPAREA